MMIDVDKFKFFNDHFGHSFGDKVLSQVAQRISTNIRKEDIAGRYGGDEFIVILHNLTNEEAQLLAKRILSSVGQISIDNTQIELGLSIGIVNYNNEKNVNEIIIKADQAMYQAKKEGGSRYRIMYEASAE
jgi:diguanylate cyclase (GGDEF)-like protein